MIRTVTSLAAALALVLAGGELLAQDAWPPISSASQAAAATRGPGFYLALWKLFLLVLLLWIWVRSADWVNRDTDEMGEAIGMPAQVWNPIMVFPFLLTFVTLALLLPYFAAGYGLLALTYFGPFVTYVVMRNGKVTEDKKVFTPAHLKEWFSNLGKRKPKEREVKHAWQLGPPVELVAVGPLQMENQQALIEARQSPAFVPLKFLLADALSQRTDKIMFDYTADAVAVQYQIDGLWHAAAPKVHPKQPLDRAMGDQMLAILKRVCHLNMMERRARQEGKMRIEFEGAKYDATLLSQGTQTGERAVLNVTLVTKHIRTPEELGMRDKLREQLHELIGPEHYGLVVFAALPGDGLSTTWQSALRNTDRLMRDFIAVEETHKPEPYVENVDVHKFDASKGETPQAMMPKLILRQPEVMCIPELGSGEALRLLCDWIRDETKLGLVSLRAKDAADAIARLMALKAPPEAVAETLQGVVYVRLIRKLCDVCREAVQPDPALLQRLGIPPGRVQVLYREKQPPQPGQERKRGVPEICPACRGLGYRGRTGIFEFLVLDDRMRQALRKQPNVDTIRQLARAAGNRTLQEEGILLVALGITSLAELQRVLKQ